MDEKRVMVSDVYPRRRISFPDPRIERVEAAARAMLGLDHGDALDMETVSAEIARRRLSLWHIGSDVVELREGDTVRWRGRWTWENGQAWEEWVDAERA